MGLFVQVVAKDWASLRQVPDLMPGYVFRGQSSESWDMSTSLERAIKQHDEHFEVLNLKRARNCEHWMLHEFKRKFRIYSSNAPEDTDNFEWLAIMQHYGAPTRLSDFTHSFYIGSFFAVESAIGDAALWAVDVWRLREQLRLKFGLAYEHGKVLRDVINIHHIGLANSMIGESGQRDPKQSAVTLEPKRLTARMAQQQGLFLMPTNVEFPFMENLFTGLGQPKTTMENIDFEEFVKLTRDARNMFVNDRFGIVKFVIPANLRHNIMRELAAMNITSETLFPGLDGLAKSLTQTVIIS